MDGLAEQAGSLALPGLMLALSAASSAAETALFSLTPADLVHCRARGGAADRALLTLHDDLRRVLLTILFSNMATTVLFFAIATLQAARSGGPGTLEEGTAVRVLIAGVVSLAAVLLIGEVLPKNAAMIRPLFFARLTAVPLLLLHRVLARPLIGFDRFARAVVRAAGLGGRASRNATAELAAEELRLLIETSHADGVISPTESDWLARTVALPDTRLREVMTHRVEVVAVDRDDPVAYAVERARVSGRARLPVRDPERDEWIGWVDGRELCLNPPTQPDARVRDHLQPPLWLSELDRADQALSRLLTPEGRLAFIVDEHGVVTGLATRADLLAELFGQLIEEARPDDAIREVEGGWIMPGSSGVRAWRKLLGDREDLPDCATVGGLVTVLLGRSPRRGDVVHWRNVRLEVLSVAGQRPTEVALRIAPSSPRSLPEK